MNFPNILIITYGRTGSTLLMGVLNSIPEVLITGENMNLCANLFYAYEALQETKNKHGTQAQDSTKPFFGADKLDERLFLKDAHNLLKHQLVKDSPQAVSCWGFKEIRYTPNALRHAGRYSLEAYLDFLAALLPKSAFVFLTRNHDEVVTSAFWQNRERADAISGMVSFEKMALKWSNKRDDSFWIDYVNLVGRDKKLSSLFDFLGAEYNVSRIQEVLSQEHSYSGKPENLAGAKLRSSSGRSTNLGSNKANEKIANNKITIYPLEHVLHASFDNPESNISCNEPFFIRGVVLLKKNIPSGCHLVLSTPEGEKNVRWGVRSPKIAHEYPANPYSKSARFKTDSFKLSEGQNANLYLIDETNIRHILATIGVD